MGNGGTLSEANLERLWRSYRLRSLPLGLLA